MLPVVRTAGSVVAAADAVVWAVVFVFITEDVVKLLFAVDEVRMVVFRAVVRAVLVVVRAVLVAVAE